MWLSLRRNIFNELSEPKQRTTLSYRSRDRLSNGAEFVPLSRQLNCSVPRFNRPLSHCWRKPDSVFCIVEASFGKLLKHSRVDCSPPPCKLKLVACVGKSPRMVTNRCQLWKFLQSNCEFHHFVEVTWYLCILKSKCCNYVTWFSTESFSFILFTNNAITSKAPPPTIYLT